MRYSRLQLLCVVVSSLLFLASCGDEEQVVGPESNQLVVIPLEVDYTEFDRTDRVQGTVTIPESVGAISSASFRWEGTSELGTATCSNSGTPYVSGPSILFATQFTEMNAVWVAEEIAGGPGLISGEQVLEWLHSVPPEDRITDPPWELLVGRELEFFLIVDEPFLTADCDWTVVPRGTLTSASLVVKQAE